MKLFKAFRASTHGKQGCQMAYFQTKNPSLGKCWSVFAMDNAGVFYGHWLNFVAIWYRYFMVIWFIFSRFGMLHREKSGSPDGKGGSERCCECQSK
jgi:hypothetical protein